MIQENELKQILSADLRPSVIIDAKIEEAYNRIRSTEIPLTSNKNLLVRRIMVGMGSVAAVLALMVTFCVMNPVLAREIPIVGGIFNKLSELFSFGQIPEEETITLFQEAETTAVHSLGRCRSTKHE